jgi:hypothetical protein
VVTYSLGVTSANTKLWKGLIWLSSLRNMMSFSQAMIFTHCLRFARIIPRSSFIWTVISPTARGFTSGPSSHIF